MIRVFVLLIGGHKESGKAKRKPKPKEKENAEFCDGAAEREESYSKDVKRKAKRHRVVVLEDNSIPKKAKRRCPACTKRSNSRQDSQPTFAQNLQRRREDHSPLLNLLVLVILANYFTTMERVCIIATF